MTFLLRRLGQSALVLWAVGAAQLQGRAVGLGLIGGLVVSAVLGAALLPVARPAAAGRARRSACPPPR